MSVWRIPSVSFLSESVHLEGLKAILQASEIAFGLSVPNRAMQPRCAMRFESQTPKSLAMRKSFFASDAKTHSLDLKSHEK